VISAASSTPVGPPPTMNIESAFFIFSFSATTRMMQKLVEHHNILTSNIITSTSQHSRQDN